MADVQSPPGTQCGLDKARQRDADMETQESVFRAQLALGKELSRPISVSAIQLTALLHKTPLQAKMSFHNRMQLPGAARTCA